jgi:hypothetical protein
VLPVSGLDLVMHGGILRYGSWADRPRYVVQSQIAVCILSTDVYPMLIRHIAFFPVIVASGLPCGYLSSFAVGYIHYTFHSASLKGNIPLEGPSSVLM